MVSSVSMNGPCNCFICNIARKSGLNYLTRQQIKKSVKNRREIIKTCSRCLQKIGKGIVHKFSLRLRKERLLNLVDLSTKNITENTATQIIKTKLKFENKKNFIKSNKTTLLASASRPLPIQILKKKKFADNETKDIFTVSDITRIQCKLNLSTNQTLKLAKSIRQTTKNSKIIEKNLESKLLLRNKSLDRFF